MCDSVRKQSQIKNKNDKLAVAKSIANNEDPISVINNKSTVTRQGEQSAFMGQSLFSQHQSVHSTNIKKDEENLFSDCTDIEISDTENDYYGKEEDPNKKKNLYEINYLEDIGLLKEIKKLRIYQKHSWTNTQKKKFKKMSIVDKPEMDLLNTPILKNHEKFNVDIPKQHEECRKMHMDMIYEKINKRKEYIQNLGVDTAPYSFKILDDTDPNDKNKNLINPQIIGPGHEFGICQELKRNLSSKHSEMNLEGFDLSIEPERDPSYYHYKRWLWIMFPWICMSTDENLCFSEVIAKCYSSATKYMSVKEEKDYTQAALKIAFSVKLNFQNSVPDNKMATPSQSMIFTKNKQFAIRDKGFKR